MLQNMNKLQTILITQSEANNMLSLIFKIMIIIVLLATIVVFFLTKRISFLTSSLVSIFLLYILLNHNVNYRVPLCGTKDRLLDA